ncbi:MAG: helix-turn-helix domain-containing protein [Rhodobacter sp.]|nr:helix-turn-helix domain-containing protein [Rhodobacter sp.]
MTMTDLKNPESPKADKTRPASPLKALSPAQVREKAGLSPVEMAKLLGMSPTGYGQWEAGTRRPGGPAYRLLYLISVQGDAVIEALRKA